MSPNRRSPMLAVIITLVEVVFNRWGSHPLGQTS